MQTDVSKLLADPQPGMTLDQLAAELNGLAKLRDNARVAFCKRLALVYLMVVGHRPRQGGSGGSNGAPKFYAWCKAKIRSANGKQYTNSTLRTYVFVGFSKNPERVVREATAATHNRTLVVKSLGSAVERAIRTDAPPKVIPITKLKQQGMPTDVAREVNVLMTAWEQASSQARSQFIYIVTGKRVAA